MEQADVSVRPATVADTPAIAAVQLRSWRESFRDLLAPEALESMTDSAAEGRYAEHWRESLTRPPSRHHQVVVALTADRVVGFAAYGPSTDDDRWPRTDAELYTLVVDPDSYRGGHGSRLLNATVDLLREDTFQTLSMWAFEDDKAMRGFLTGAGWAADGSNRGLDLGDAAPESTVRQVRMVTRLA